ncbi:MAG TPA: ABC transporter ATP-binding protein [Gammaproteobacteria bacterium]|nr:ABC transporter ATP-binding protein [Gammaproteobacteria bacterium]
MNERVLEARGLHKSFKRKGVLRGLDLGVPAGAVMGLLGKNGAGKTTLIECLLGLTRPDEGQISLLGHEPWDMGTEVRQRIGYVPQTSSGFGWMRVGELVRYIGAFYANWNMNDVQRLLAWYELEEDAKVGTLSEGQRQRLAIVQAMGHDPDLLVLDEPVASLDPAARRNFLKELIEFNARPGKTVLFSTHITSDLERSAAQVAILKEGRIVFNGGIDELKERVCRLHIHSGKSLPAVLPAVRTLRYEAQGNTAFAVTDGISEHELRRLEQQLAARINLEYLSLEDIFVELNR